MQITFSPMRHDGRLTLSRRGDILTVNGEDFDFSGVPEGGSLPRASAGCEWLASDVERVADELRLTLLLPHGAEAPGETLFPEPLSVTGDGPIAVPPHGPAEAGAG